MPLDREMIKRKISETLENSRKIALQFINNGQVFKRSNLGESALNFSARPFMSLFESSRTTILTTTAQSMPEKHPCCTPVTCTLHFPLESKKTLLTKSVILSASPPSEHL
jgi:ureidoglycolate hydrolase